MIKCEDPQHSGYNCEKLHKKNACGCENCLIKDRLDNAPSTDYYKQKEL